MHGLERGHQFGDCFRVRAEPFRHLAHGKPRADQCECQQAGVVTGHVAKYFRSVCRHAVPYVAKTTPVLGEGSTEQAAIGSLASREIDERTLADHYRRVKVDQIGRAHV